jgi:hypothetical protein
MRKFEAVDRKRLLATFLELVAMFDPTFTYAPGSAGRWTS